MRKCVGCMEACFCYVRKKKHCDLSRNSNFFRHASVFLTIVTFFSLQFASLFLTNSKFSSLKINKTSTATTKQTSVYVDRQRKAQY